MTNTLALQSILLTESYDRFLRTLCNKTRFSIIESLMQESKNVSQLTEELDIHQTSVSHALKRLLICGFVVVERQGKERLYSVNRKTIQPFMKLMQEHVRTYCEGCNV